MTPIEERFTIAHLNNVKDFLHDAFKELSRITRPSMNAIRLNIVRAMNAIDVEINKLKEIKK